MKRFLALFLLAFPAGALTYTGGANQFAGGPLSMTTISATGASTTQGAATRTAWATSGPRTTRVSFSAT